MTIAITDTPTTIDVQGDEAWIWYGDVGVYERTGPGQEVPPTLVYASDGTSVDESDANEAVHLLAPEWGLFDYDTGEHLRTATHAEYARSCVAARRDGGAGVITVDGRRCYCVE